MSDRGVDLRDGAALEDDVELMMGDCDGDDKEEKRRRDRESGSSGEDRPYMRGEGSIDGWRWRRRRLARRGDVARTRGKSGGDVTARLSQRVAIRRGTVDGRDSDTAVAGIDRRTNMADV